MSTITGTPVVGGWYAVCCLDDLYRIEDGQTVADILESYGDENDDMPLRVRCWPTLREALAELVNEELTVTTFWGTDQHPTIKDIMDWVTERKARHPNDHEEIIHTLTELNFSPIS